MIIRLITLAAAFFSFAFGVNAQTSPGPNDVLDRDFRVMMEWFPGRYDNQEQVYFQNLLDTPEEARNGRIHSIFFPVELDGFSGETFYVQQYGDNDPSKVYRQRVYAFTPDYEENAIRLTIFTPKAPETLLDAHLDPSKLEGLGPDDMIARPGCEVYWRRQAGQFVGYMKPRACSFVSERSGKRIFITDDLFLSEHKIWISDQAEDEDGAYVFGNKAGVPHKNNRARDFKCWVAVKKRNGEDWTFVRDVAIHDNGDWAEISTDERRPKTVYIRMRNVKWPYGRNRDSLTLYVHEDKDASAVSYAWNEANAERVAVNLRWMQASCTVDKSSFAYREDM
ncbi:MAG: chromophore lyase CpcT/CpeT [Pseudomonadota bacterium]